MVAASRALKAAWFHTWIKDLRLCPFTPSKFDVLYDPQMLQLEATLVDLSNTLSGGLTAVTILAFSGLMLNEANPAADGKSGKVVVRR